MSGKPGTYLWYCLRYKVIHIVEGIPTQSDLEKIAAQVAPAFSVLQDLDRSVVLEVLETVFDRRAGSPRVQDAYLVLSASGTLGPLLGDAEAELDAMLPHLKAWYLANTEEFRALEPPGHKGASIPPRRARRSYERRYRQFSPKAAAGFGEI
jgi:hypothetical protein